MTIAPPSSEVNTINRIISLSFNMSLRVFSYIVRFLSAYITFKYSTADRSIVLTWRLCFFFMYFLSRLFVGSKRATANADHSDGPVGENNARICYKENEKKEIFPSEPITGLELILPSLFRSIPAYIHNIFIIVVVYTRTLSMLLCCCCSKE